MDRDKIIGETITIKEAAKLLGVHPDTIRRWEKKGFIQASGSGKEKNKLFNKKMIKELTGPFGLTTPFERTVKKPKSDKSGQPVSNPTNTENNSIKTIDNYNYFKEEQKKLEEIANIYRGEAEKPLTGLSKNLILVATIFIALSSSVIGSTVILNTNEYIKIIFILSLAILIFSIFFGLVQFIVEVKFYRKWVSAISKIVKEIALGTFKSIEDYKQAVDDKINKLPTRSSTWPLILQGVFLFLGISTFGFFIYKFLF